jgi:DNA (cytosine-5)-methyltransferase 1
MGLHRAGFDVTGVDIRPQPHYPFRFIQADAMTFDLDGFNFIWASPPCQCFTRARVIHGNEHPDLLTPTRDRLMKQDAPWIIENVPGAPMRPDVVLCGSMFGQPKLIRHRWFECSWKPLLLVHPCQHAKETISVFGHGGHVYHGVQEWREIMEIDWMTRDELAQAIPPYYSEFLGRQIIKMLAA